MSRKLRVSPVALLWIGATTVAFAASACGGEGDQPPQAEAPPEQAPQEEAPQEVAPGVRRLGPNRYQVEIHAFEGGYRPSEIRLPAGSEVTFRVTSDDVEHGFTLEGTDVVFELTPNRFSEATHVFAEPGEYAFQCHLYCGGGHESMRGKIIVEAR
jgi:cytochrome c oxidase subunit 2